MRAKLIFKDIVKGSIGCQSQAAGKFLRLKRRGIRTICRRNRLAVM